jgi:PAS domain S-box-containing protein
MSAPRPPREAERLQTLRSYEVLDTPPEQAFDDLTLLAAQICHAPLAQISLVDEDRQWFKSRIGSDVTETPRSIAFCAHTILHADEVMEIRDTQIDGRFEENPLVTGDPGIRFYAGAPLVAPDGQVLGALCVMDRAPRTLTSEQVAALRALSRHVIAQLELRRQARELTQELAARDRVEAELRRQFDQLVASERESNRLLGLAERSRRALLSVLEDEKQSSQSLRESEERFRQLAENITEVFWITDPAMRVILYVSPAYVSIWGRTCESLYASPVNWFEAIHPDDRTRVMAATASWRKQGKIDEIFRIVRPDGTIRWIHDRGFPVLDRAGEVYRLAGTAADVTERKSLEEQFLHAQRLEAIGTLASGVAHDLNNILAPILMAAGLLKDKIVAPRDLAVLKMIESSAQRGAGIIRQLLTFGRGAQGERVSIQPKHLLREMVQIMQETFPRNLTIEADLPNDLWIVLADATQLHQVLLNLCVNARDAMPGGGTLTLGARNLLVDEAEARRLGQATSGRYLLITVADTGHGIPPEVIGRIFDPFFTTKELGKGTGLGLSTVVGIVKSHRGFVAVESEPGRGTIFKVYLPADAEASATASGTVAPMAAGCGELILMVDDELPILDAASRVLREHGYRVITAGNGEEAIKLFLEHTETVRLVLTDVMMPVMGGVELIRALRVLAPDVCVVATTGLDYEDTGGELAALGVAEVLSKPCSSATLLLAIQRALANHG